MAGPSSHFAGGLRARRDITPNTIYDICRQIPPISKNFFFDENQEEMIKIIDSSDTELNVELISIIEDNDKKYLIYSKNERQKSENLVLYVSKLRIKEGTYYLENITDEQEWINVKRLMSNIING